mmetsp:Transcript_34513/g.135757  ORF Transcript_34513/g.135757 Transcript_34513/m.135757 type:complete len:107 (+) Transcript_34513:770-1090(+)
MHRMWKASFVKSLGATPDMKIIDVAGGTGDISFRILDEMKQIGALESPIKVRMEPLLPGPILQGSREVGCTLPSPVSSTTKPPQQSKRFLTHPSLCLKLGEEERAN